MSGRVFDWGDADSTDAGGWAAVFDTNLAAAGGSATSLLPELAARPGGLLIYIGSMAGHHAFPHNAADVASKHRPDRPRSRGLGGCS